MFASEQILREVQALRKAGKPVVVSMSTYAASGGYYIAAAANEIFASPTTMTGSIGVFSVVPTFEHTLEKLGVRSTASAPAGRGRHAPRPAAGPRAKPILQSSVDHAYAEFLRRVGEGRKKSVDEVDKIAQGRVWSGADAQRIGSSITWGAQRRDCGRREARRGGRRYDGRVHGVGADAARTTAPAAAHAARYSSAQTAGLIAPAERVRGHAGPILAEARMIARLDDPRGLYAYCWCKEPAGLRRALVPASRQARTPARRLSGRAPRGTTDSSAGDGAPEANRAPGRKNGN